MALAWKGSSADAAGGDRHEELAASGTFDAIALDLMLHRRHGLELLVDLPTSSPVIDSVISSIANDAPKAKTATRKPQPLQMIIGPSASAGSGRRSHGRHTPSRADACRRACIHV